MMIGIGIIGCGGMGRYHSRSLMQVPDVQITAAADMSGEALAAYAREFHPAHIYSDFHDLVNDAAVDAVLVCLPTYLHPPAVLAAAQARKQVFCEKPIAMTVQAAEEMIAACDKAGVHFMIGFVRRFDHDWGTFKRLVEAGAIGRPVVWRHVIASGGPRNPWYLDRDKGGGPIVDGAIHDIDFANWLFGEMVWATGTARSFKASSYDTVTVSIGYERGDELLLSWTWGLPFGATGMLGHDAIGPGGAVLFPGYYAEKELPSGLVADKQGAYIVDTGSDSGRRPEVFEKNDMFLDEMKHFVQCCKTGERPSVTGEDGLDALRVCLAALGEARKA
ncbi:MAG: Gfo/Idh/MocA family protein [Anaerolineae bacterium]